MVPPQIADSRCYQVQGLPLAHPNPARRHPKTKTKCFSRTFFFEKNIFPRKKVENFSKSENRKCQKKSIFFKRDFEISFANFQLFFRKFSLFFPEKFQIFSKSEFFRENPKFQNFEKKYDFFFIDPTDFTLPWTVPTRLE